MASNPALTPMIVRKISKEKTSTVTSMNDIKNLILVEKLPKPIHTNKLHHLYFRDSSLCKRKCYKNEDCSGLEKCYNGECQESCIDDSDCPQPNRKCLGGRCGYD